MKTIRAIRFWIANLLIGNSSYMKNIHLDWNQNLIVVHDLFYMSCCHTEGDPFILQGNKKVKLSETSLFE